MPHPLAKAGPPCTQDGPVRLLWCSEEERYKPLSRSGSTKRTYFPVASRPLRISRRAPSFGRIVFGSSSAQRLQEQDDNWTGIFGPFLSLGLTLSLSSSSGEWARALQACLHPCPSTLPSHALRPKVCLIGVLQFWLHAFSLGLSLPAPPTKACSHTWRNLSDAASKYNGTNVKTSIQDDRGNSWYPCNVSLCWIFGPFLVLDTQETYNSALCMCNYGK